MSDSESNNSVSTYSKSKDSKVITAYQLIAKVKIVLAMKMEIICMLRYISIIVTRRIKCCKENPDLLAEKFIVAIKCITLGAETFASFFAFREHKLSRIGQK